VRREEDPAMNEPPVSNEGELTSFRNRNFQFRSESRYKSPLAALAYIRTDPQAKDRETVWLANLSIRGVGFLSKSPLPAKLIVHIEIPALALARREITAEVMHATQQINGDWLVGCQLATPLTDEELETCLSFDSPYLSKLKNR